MRLSTFISYPPLATLIIATLGACPGPTGHDGPAIRMRTSTISPGPTCSNGGTLIEYGLDDGAGAAGNNGALDDDEIDGSTPVCNGATGPTGDQGSPGHASLIAVDADVGAACSSFGNKGGQRIRAGTDDGASPDDGVLQDDEVDAEEVICNGATGIKGDTGAKGDDCWEAVPGGDDVNDCVDYVHDQVVGELPFYHVLDVSGTQTIEGNNGAAVWKDVNALTTNIALQTAARALRITWTQSMSIKRGTGATGSSCYFRLLTDGALCATFVLVAADVDPDRGGEHATRTFVGHCTSPGATFTKGAQIALEGELWCNSENLEVTVGSGVDEGRLEVLELPPGMIDL